MTLAKAHQSRDVKILYFQKRIIAMTRPQPDVLMHQLKILNKVLVVYCSVPFVLRTCQVCSWGTLVSRQAIAATEMEEAGVCRE